MNKQEKSAFVESFREQVRAAPLVVVASFTGTQVNVSNKLRRDLESSGVRVRVIKNTLARLALQGTGREALGPHLKGMNLMALSSEDPVASAKVLKDAFGEIKTIEVRCGFFDGEVLDADGIAAVATLPSREELLSSLLRTIQEPVRQLMGVIEGPARDLMFLLKNYEDKFNETEGA
jgi:large subunit ribosomal protein L10